MVLRCWAATHGPAAAYSFAIARTAAATAATAATTRLISNGGFDAPRQVLKLVRLHTQTPGIVPSTLFLIPAFTAVNFSSSPLPVSLPSLVSEIYFMCSSRSVLSGWH